ncbi:T9SS type A sorting domain-containing protein [Membranihabitans marinus]|uniref:T9SS type A sorting domain-containing protein n=1 Tax=Membranihabitans marinus TaxID=1227546 RepID=UPI001F412156|nr:T9SS type A sorting domain-containing protein [Membranihabitans marinus]
MKKLFLFLFFIVFFGQSWAQTYITAISGNWSPTLPTTLISGETILISSGHTITLDADIEINGTLTISAGAILEGPYEITVGSTGTITNLGELNIEEVMVNDGIITNNGTLTASEDITVNGSLTNTGTISTSADITVNGSLTNSNSLTSTGDVNIHGTLSNSTMIEVDIMYCGGTLINSGSITLGNSRTLELEGAIVSGGGEIIADKLHIHKNPSNTPAAIVDMVFCDRNGNTPQFVGGGVSETDFITNGDLTECSINEFVFFCENRVSPIELKFFQTEVYNNSHVTLEWITSSETNNAYFEIQRSHDGQTWQHINKVYGAGTTPIAQYYSTTDLEPISGKSWYRLKQVDFDGSYSYSHTEIVVINKRDILSIYPNPSRDHITISGKNIDLSQVKLYNGLGQELSQSIDIGSGIISHQIIDLSNLPANIYYLKIDETLHKIIKQ